MEDVQEYLQNWEKQNNPFYPSEMRWDRLQVNIFLKDYKKQLTLTDVVKPSYCHSEEAGGFRCGEQCLGCDGMERDKKQ